MIKRIRFLTLLILLVSAAAFADVVYNNIPSPLPPNVPSLGYQATQTSEFGGLIQFAGSGSHALGSATVAMSDWAYYSNWASAVNGTTITTNGFYVPLTLSIYDVAANNSVGKLIGADTLNAFIPWRSEPSSGCGDGWRAGDGKCYGGSLSTVTFDLSRITVPNEVIYGLSFNTETWGASPTGVDGPYDSLNFALSETQPSVGSNPLPDTAYWATSTAGWYTDGGAGGVGTFRQDTEWTYSGAIEFTDVPEPASSLLIGMGLAGIGFIRRKARR
jgi:hypothetical protein